MSIVDLNEYDIESEIKDLDICDEYFEVTLQIDHCVKRMLCQIRKIEKVCFDKKIFKYFANLQYAYNQIISWRTEVDEEKDRICEALAWWYNDSLRQIKKLSGRFRKHQKYEELYQKSIKYLDTMKNIIRSPRYKRFN